MLFQTKNGNPHHFLIQGERGIGKSSLLFFLQLIAGGHIESVRSGLFNFVTVSVELEPSTDYYEIVRKIGTSLRASLGQHKPVEELLKTVWNFVKNWEVMGVKYSPAERAAIPQEMLDELIGAIARTVDAMRGEIDGVLILIDEADKPPVAAHLGQFIKTFTERLTKLGCNKIAVGLAGITGIMNKLRESHESSPRILRVLTLEPLLPAERVEVIRKGLKVAEETNGFEVTITEDAEKTIAGFSEGYPHFIQQFAYSAFEADTDNNIDQDDVRQGSTGENGAFEQLGVRYFQHLYFDQIGSNAYRAVLHAMAPHLDGDVTKQQIREKAGISETKLTNAIAALKARNIIIPKEGTKGVYRLPNKSFAVWVGAFTSLQGNAKE